MCILFASPSLNKHPSHRFLSFTRKPARSSDCGSFKGPFKSEDHFHFLELPGSNEGRTWRLRYLGGWHGREQDGRTLDEYQKPKPWPCSILVLHKNFQWKSHKIPLAGLKRAMWTATWSWRSSRPCRLITRVTMYPLDVKSPSPIQGISPKAAVIKCPQQVQVIKWPNEPIIFHFPGVGCGESFTWTVQK